MAKEKLKLSLGLVRNNNAESTGYGKWYPTIVSRQPLTMDALVDHITAHAMQYPRDIVEGVVTRISRCLPELLSQGVSVRLDGIGTFTPWAQSKRGGVARPEAGLNPKDLIKGIHIRCIPEGRKAQNLTAKAFKEKCVLSLDYVVEGSKNKKTYTEIAAWVEEHAN